MATQVPMPARYEPPQNELNYYNELFAFADQSKTGEINGNAAVAFLSRSKLPVDLLRNIWTMADQPKTNSLDRYKFYTAIRLIQLFQNGQKATGPGLQSHGILRPPFFEGVTGISIMPFEMLDNAAAKPSQPVLSATHSTATANSSPSPRRDSQLSYVSTTAGPPAAMASSPPMGAYPHPQPAAADPSMGGTNTALTHDPYLMLPGEKIRYEALFPQYSQEDYVYGAQAVELFTKSGLSKEVLRDIWNLVDNPVDNRLDLLEFAIAMHLIVCVSKKNLPLPKTLPFSLKSLKEKAGTKQAEAVSPPRMHPSGPAVQYGHAGTGSPVAVSIPVVQHTRTTSQGTYSGIQPSMSYGSGYGSGGAAAAMPPVGAAPNIPLGGATIGNISEAFEDLAKDGEQGGPPDLRKSAAASTSTFRSSFPVNSPALSATSQEELEKVKSVLQKLQAENVSLKAQLGQYSEEEKSIREEIAKTVNEIGTLSHDLTLLRSQVVEAKTSLIEASTELKAQVEKRDLLQSLIQETLEIKDVLENGAQTLHSVQESVKEIASRGTSVTGPPDINKVTQPTQTSSYNPFDDAGSVLTDAFTGDNMSTNAYHPQYTSGSAQRVPKYDKPPDTSYHVVQNPQETHVTDEEMQMLASLKAAADQAENDARSASDHAKALGLQFEDIRKEADEANAIAYERQNSKPKKKGLFKGGAGKKEYQKEVEAAVKEAAEKADEAQKAYENLRMAQENAAKMKQEADHRRANADKFEMQLADKLTTMQHSKHASQARSITGVMSTEEFGAVARGQAYASEVNSHNHEAFLGYGPSENHHHYQNTSLMGVGGYPGSPNRVFDSTSPSDLMGGVPHQGIMGNTYDHNHSANSPSRSVVTVDAQTQSLQNYDEKETVNFNTEYPNLRPTGVNAKFNNNNSSSSGLKMDSSIAEISDAGISYASDRRSAAEYSNAGVSYGSNRNGLEQKFHNRANPRNANGGGNGNINDYPSYHYSHQTGPTMAEVAPMPPLDFSTGHTGDGTDSSIQGSVSRAGTISEYDVSNRNPDITTAEGSARNAGFAEEAEDGPWMTGPRNFDNSARHDFGGIPSPEKEDTFELDGGITGHTIYRKEGQEDYKNSTENPVSNDAFDGIPSPDNNDKSQHVEEVVNQSSRLEGNTDLTASDEVESQVSHNMISNLGSTADTSALGLTSGLIPQSNSNRQFNGIPSPEKKEQVGIFGNFSNDISTGLGAMPSSSEADLWIPTPTASNSYSDPFGV